MLGYMAYHGMPSHYPHWSFGKSFEQLKTMYSYGVQGLPYEMVINSDPCLAYLMRDNSLCLQVLTIAHVYGHNDFFKNNFTFTSATRAGETHRRLQDPRRSGAQLPRGPVDRHRGRRAPARRRPRALDEPLAQPGDPPSRQPRSRLFDWIETLAPPRDEFAHLAPKPEPVEIDLSRMPLEPDQNLLLFIRDHNPRARRLGAATCSTIVDEEARYFLPADRDQDHERGLGQLLAPPDHEPRSICPRTSTSSSWSATTR